MAQGAQKKIQPRWEEIFSSLGDGLLVLDPERRLIGINPAAERVTGFSAESVLGQALFEAFVENRSVIELLHPSFEEARVTTLREAPWKAKGEAGKGPASLTVDLTLTPLISGWILVIRDVTPMKGLQEEVRKSDRLAMMGTIAAGLAHEIKNPLGGIKGAAQLLARENQSPESAEFLQIIIKEVDRVDRLVSRLLSFSRPRTLTLVPLNLNEILDSLLLLQTAPLNEKKIRLVRKFDPSLPSILGDADELRQVFLNFLKNAIEAIPEGGATIDGRAEIRVTSRLVTNFKIREVTGQKASRMVVAEIHDSGVGIAREDLEKIFTPFFTTKENGHGLGLAMAQRVIQEHGGSIQLKSEKSQGTTVQVFLRSAL